MACCLHAQYLHWTEVFINKLNNKVKMVGAMINCEGAPKDGDASAQWRNSPFVMSYVWATDKVKRPRLAK